MPRTEQIPAPPSASAPDEATSPSEPMNAEAPLPDSPVEESRRETAETHASEEREPREEYHPEPVARAPRRDFRPASPAAVTEAIEEVNRIMTSLRQVLDTMEEILETLELAEAQKTADEREIQSLRSALRQLDRRGAEPRREAQEPSAHPQPSREPRRQGRR